VAALASVRRVVVSHEHDAPAPATDAGYYSSELGVPVRVDASLALELTPDVVFDRVRGFALASLPAVRIASIEATPSAPPGFEHDFQYDYSASAFWEVQLLGRVPAGAPPCVPGRNGQPQPICSAPPDFINPTLVMPDAPFGNFAVGQIVMQRNRSPRWR
jgi:hypothetical protein